MNWRKLWPETLILAVGAFLRLWYLDLKPPHFDEGINGWFVDQMFGKGFFQYDPSNYHGPLHFYLIQVSQLIFGFNVTGLRMVTVAFSMATLVLLIRHRRFLGRAALWGAAAFAVSPAFVFYSRYSIHESELTFFLVLINYALLKWMFEKSQKAWVYFAVGVVGALVTKETWVIHAAVFAIAWALLPILKKWIPESELVDELAPTARSGHVEKSWIWAWVSGSLLVVILFFSGFMHDPKGILNFGMALVPWFHTGTVGNGHEKPWYYWLQVMWRYETILLVGLVACTLGIRSTSRAIRFIGLVGAGSLAAYSIVAYKTPWCIMSFLWAFCLTFGYAFESALRQGRHMRSLVVAIVLALGIYSLYRTVDLNFFSYDKESEPYVYVSSFRELKGFYDSMDQMVDLRPSLGNSKIMVCLQSYWPLPWILRAYPNVTFSGRSCSEKDMDQDILLVDISDSSRLRPAGNGEYLRKTYRFRGSQEDFYVYYRKSLFQGLIHDAEIPSAEVATK